MLKIFLSGLTFAIVKGAFSCDLGIPITDFGNSHQPGAGAQVRVLMSQRITCNGRIAYWEYYAGGTGCFVAAIWERHGSSSFILIGKNKIAVPGKGKHTYTVPYAEQIEVKVGQYAGNHLCPSGHRTLTYAYTSSVPGLTLDMLDRVYVLDSGYHDNNLPANQAMSGWRRSSGIYTDSIMPHIIEPGEEEHFIYISAGGEERKINMTLEQCLDMDAFRVKKHYSGSGILRIRRVIRHQSCIIIETKNMNSTSKQSLKAFTSTQNEEKFHGMFKLCIEDHRSKVDDIITSRFLCQCDAYPCGVVVQMRDNSKLAKLCALSYQLSCDEA